MLVPGPEEMGDQVRQKPNLPATMAKFTGSEKHLELSLCLRTPWQLSEMSYSWFLRSPDSSPCAWPLGLSHSDWSKKSA